MIIILENDSTYFSSAFVLLNIITSVWLWCSHHPVWCVFSTSLDFQYIGGCSVHWGIPWEQLRDTRSTLGDIMSTLVVGVFSTSEGYHEYIEGCSVHWGIPWLHWGDIMSISGHVQYSGGYHDTCTKHQSLYSCMISLQCTEHSLMYSWYPPHSSWYPPDVLNISRFTHDIPPSMYSWYPPDVLNTPQCTEYTLYSVVTPMLK